MSWGAGGGGREIGISEMLRWGVAKERLGTADLESWWMTITMSHCFFLYKALVEPIPTPHRTSSGNFFFKGDQVRRRSPKWSPNKRMKRQKESKREAHHLFTEAPLRIRVIFNLSLHLHNKSSYSSWRPEPEQDGKGSRTIPTPCPKSVCSPIYHSSVDGSSWTINTKTEAGSHRRIELPSLWGTPIILRLQIHKGRILKCWESLKIVISLVFWGHGVGLTEVSHIDCMILSLPVMENHEQWLYFCNGMPYWATIAPLLLQGNSKNRGVPETEKCFLGRECT